MHNYEFLESVAAVMVVWWGGRVFEGTRRKYVRRE
jgi:hypothetical protein